MNRRQQGFTLIELIIVMVVTAVVVTMVSMVVNRPLSGYFDSQRRADLTERAQTAINRITLELENTLPYSLRTTNMGRTLEFMPALAMGLYRNGGAPQQFVLNVKKSESSFTSFLPLDSTLSGRLVVNNTSPIQLYTDASEVGVHDGVITEAANTMTVSDCWIDSKTDTNCADGGSLYDRESLVTLSNAHKFDQAGSGSPFQRFYVVQDAVTYHCDLTTGTLRRFQGYALSVAQNPAPSGPSNAILASGVTACNFTINPGSGTFRVPTVTLTLTLEAAGESVNLLKEVAQWNAP